MGSLSGTLRLPATGEKIRAKRRVDYKDSEEAALVRRVQVADQMAFREIVERYQSKVFSIIYGILRNHNDAEDIAQQVFTKVYFSIGSFDFRSSLLTWVYKITVNECYDYLRKRKVRRLVYESDFSQEDALRAESPDHARDPRPSVEVAAAQRDLALKLLARLSEEERSLLLLKEVEGHSVEELAEMTGINENTIKVKLFRARQKLVKVARRLGRSPRVATG
jgi:RNA polymerase sigma-70 factor (ECF subfamily)